MTLRIAVGGFLHESHSFAPRPTGWEEFVRPSGVPMRSGAALLDAVRDTSFGIAGAIAAAEAAGAVLVPLTWCFAGPAGPVTDAAFERIAGLICGGLTQALQEGALQEGALDGVFLDLHGAAVADSFPDAEGELLRRVRHVVGDLPVTVSLDPHANLTAAMVAGCDAVVPYRTYPHVDMREAGAQAMRLLLARIDGAPFAAAYRQLDYWMPITSQCTLLEPMAGVMAERAALAGQPGVIELAWCFGFPYADFAGCGPALVAYATTAAIADATADAFLSALERRERAFGSDILPAREAVAQALLGASGRPVVIADTQDNPGGGGHGDTTGLLAELVAQGARGAVVCLINDAESAAACHAAGAGASVALRLGGRSDGVPFVAQARVLLLTDGQFRLTGPMGAGNPADLGPMALVELEPGIRVVVASRKMQAHDQAILRHVGIEPAGCPIIALKSSVHFRADFGPIAGRVIVAAAPGPVVADPATLPFRHLRPGLRIRPGQSPGLADDRVSQQLPACGEDPALWKGCAGSR